MTEKLHTNTEMRNSLSLSPRVFIFLPTSKSLLVKYFDQVPCTRLLHTKLRSCITLSGHYSICSEIETTAK
jgi:hypothetical protein